MKALLLLFATALTVQSPFLAGRAAFVSADGTFHHSVVTQVAAAHAEGIAYPRWMPRQNGGLGDASFMHYAPLFHTLAALARPVAGGTAWGGMRLIFVLATLLAGWVAYGWMRAFLPPPRALLVAAVLAANPLALHLLLKAEAYPWACSLPVVLIFFSLLRHVDGTRIVLLRLAAIVAVQCFLHTLTALMLLVAAPLALGVSALLRRENPGRTFQRMRQFGLSSLLGLTIAGLYLVPALSTLRYVTPSAWEFQQVCSPMQSFILPLFTHGRYGMCWSSYQLLFPALSLLLLAAGAWAFRHRERGNDASIRQSADLLGFGGVALLLASELAWPLWQGSSPLRMAQFPFRFNFVALAALLPLAALVGGKTRWLLAVPLLLTLALAAQALRSPPVPTPREPVTLLGMGSLGEYRPAAARPEFNGYLARGGFPAECTGRGATCQVVRQGSGEQTFTVQASTATAVRLPLFCYPAWQLPAGSACDPATGLIEVRAVPGLNTFTVPWTMLPEERMGGWCTLAGAGVFLLYSLVRFRRRSGA